MVAVLADIVQVLMEGELNTERHGAYIIRCAFRQRVYTKHKSVSFFHTDDFDSMTHFLCIDGTLQLSEI